MRPNKHPKASLDHLFTRDDDHGPPRTPGDDTESVASRDDVLAGAFYEGVRRKLPLATRVSNTNAYHTPVSTSGGGSQTALNAAMPPEYHEAEGTYSDVGGESPEDNDEDDEGSHENDSCDEDDNTDEDHRDNDEGNHDDDSDDNLVDWQGLNWSDQSLPLDFEIISCDKMRFRCPSQLLFSASTAFRDLAPCPTSFFRRSRNGMRLTLMDVANHNSFVIFLFLRLFNEGDFENGPFLAQTGHLVSFLQEWQCKTTLKSLVRIVLLSANPAAQYSVNPLRAFTIAASAEDLEGCATLLRTAKFRDWDEDQRIGIVSCPIRDGHHPPSLNPSHWPLYLWSEVPAVWSMALALAWAGAEALNLIKASNLEQGLNPSGPEGKRRYIADRFISLVRSFSAMRRVDSFVLLRKEPLKGDMHVELQRETHFLVNGQPRSELEVHKRTSSIVNGQQVFEIEFHRKVYVIVNGQPRLRTELRRVFCGVFDVIDDMPPLGMEIDN